MKAVNVTFYWQIWKRFQIAFMVCTTSVVPDQSCIVQQPLGWFKAHFTRRTKFSTRLPKMHLSDWTIESDLSPSGKHFAVKSGEFNKVEMSCRIIGKKADASEKWKNMTYLWGQCARSSRTSKHRVNNHTDVDAITQNRERGMAHKVDIWSFNVHHTAHECGLWLALQQVEAIRDLTTVDVATRGCHHIWQIIWAEFRDLETSEQDSHPQIIRSDGATGAYITQLPMKSSFWCSCDDFQRVSRHQSRSSSAYNCKVSCDDTKLLGWHTFIAMAPRAILKS